MGQGSSIDESGPQTPLFGLDLKEHNNRMLYSNGDDTDAGSSGHSTLPRSRYSTDSKIASKSTLGFQNSKSFGYYPYKSQDLLSSNLKTPPASRHEISKSARASDDIGSLASGSQNWSSMTSTSPVYTVSGTLKKEHSLTHIRDRLGRCQAAINLRMFTIRT